MKFPFNRIITTTKFLIAGLILFSTRVIGAEISYSEYNNLDLYSLEGEIEFNDISNFENILNRTRSPNKKSLIFLNSPGGNLHAAYYIGALIFKSNIATVVPNDFVCLSACFTILISGSSRFADLGSTVGVHRASLNFRENLSSKGTSVDMNEFYRSMNVPANIRLAMLDTPPSEIYVLTNEDKINISNMNVAEFKEPSESSQTKQIHPSNNPLSTTITNPLRSTNSKSSQGSQASSKITSNIFLQVNDIYGQDEIIGNISLERDSNKKFTNLKMVISRFNSTGDALWTVKDFVRNCQSPSVPNLELVTPVHTTDLNQNGINEVWMMYKESCRDRQTPADLKIIMYEGKIKHAVRGKTEVPNKYMCNNECGYFKFDSQMNSAHQAIKNYALKLWKSGVNERF